MAGYSIVRTEPSLLPMSETELEEIDDELFLDVHDLRDTQFLGVSCYDSAVLDCVVMGDNCFLLKIRPELRSPLMCQMGDKHAVYRVYSMPRQPEIRILIARQVGLRFVPETTMEDRRSALGDFVCGLERITVLKDGTYQLAERVSMNPVSALGALRKLPVVSKVDVYFFNFLARSLIDA